MNKTDFLIVDDHVASPIQIYDGIETAKVKIELINKPEKVTFTVDLDAPAAKRWRHYYTDDELNRLSTLLQFSYKFIMNSEIAVNSSLNQQIYIQPVYKYSKEFSICFSYDEVSPLHYKYWLIAIVEREMTRDDYEQRVEDIKKYWLK
jgi:hypothetical protein